MKEKKNYLDIILNFKFTAFSQLTEILQEHKNGKANLNSS